MSTETMSRPDLSEYISTKQQLKSLNERRKQLLETLKRSSDEVEDFLLTSDTKKMRIDGVLCEIKEVKSIPWNEKALREFADEDGKLDVDVYKSQAAVIKMMLAISAGGDHSAYVLGMLKGVFAKRPSVTDWTHVAGISAGALIGSQISQVEPGDRSGFIKKINHLTNSHVDFVKSWSPVNKVLGIVKGLLWHNSLFDGQLRHLIEDRWGENHRELYVGAYNQSVGRYESFGPAPSIDMITASASIPVVFQPVKHNDMTYCDGGIAHIIPIQEIKEHWKDGDLDVMICYPTDHSEYLKTCEVLSRFKIFGRVMGTIGESNWFNLMRDIEELNEMVGADVRNGGSFKVGDKTVRVYVPNKGFYCDVVNRNFNTLKRMHKHGEEIANSILS